MTRILYLVSTLARSGPTNQLYNIIKFLDRTRFHLMLVTLSPEPPDSRWRDFEELGIEIRSLGLSRLKGAFLAKNRLLHLIDQFGADVLHSQGIRADMLSSNIPGSFKKMTTTRNFPQVDYAMRYGPLKGRLMVSMHVNAFKKIDLCVGVSGAVSDNLCKRFSIQNIATIRNGVDDHVFYPPEPRQKYELRAKFGLPPDVRIWISSGHLSDIKDPLFLISAWKNMSKCKEFLVFIGDGPLYDNCVMKAKGSSNIILRGRVSNVVDYLRASDFFISSSKAEGLPNSVLEALACGLPVVLSDIGAHREIWEIVPSIGALYKQGCTEDFIRSVQGVLAKDRESMSNAAITIIKNHLSAKRMSEKYQALYSGFADTEIFK